jgi:hypothetical protein
MQLVKQGNVFKAIKQGAKIFAFELGRVIKTLFVSGVPPLTFENSTGEPLADYKIYGNSIQPVLLPDEYQQVAYIEATGTQYFEIDYIANEKTNSKGTFQITNTAKANFLFGSRVSSSTIRSYGFNWGGGQPCKYYNTYYGNSNDGMTNTNIDDQKHTFEKIGNKLYLDGTLIHTRKDTDGTIKFETPTKIAIFACNTNGTIGLQTFSRLSVLSFDEGEGDLFNLISCYRKSDGVIGMYDIVNNYFHTNQGTGEFLKGPDVPSPYSPVYLESVDAQIPAVVTGKNLLDKSQMHVMNRSANGLQWIYNAEEKAYYANGTQQAQLSSYALMLDSSAINNKLIHGHRYILAGNSTPENINTRYYVFGNHTRNGKNTYISSDMEASRFFNWENGDNISLDLRVYSTDGVFREINDAKFQPMIIDVTGLDDVTINRLTTNFEEYIIPTTTLIQLNEPLRKVGEYADYVDYKNGNIVRNVGVKTFDGSENWELHKENNDNVVYRLDNVLTPMLNAPTSATYMTHFSLTDIYSTSSFLAGTYRFGFDQDKLTITSNRLYIASDKMTLTEFKAWLAENKPTIFYPLATPIEENVNLPEIPTFSGTNILNIDTEVPASYAEIEYYANNV